MLSYNTKIPVGEYSQVHSIYGKEQPILRRGPLLAQRAFRRLCVGFRGCSKPITIELVFHALREARQRTCESPSAQLQTILWGMYFPHIHPYN
jgi:hypothetical protein